MDPCDGSPSPLLKPTHSPDTLPMDYSTDSDVPVVGLDNDFEAVETAEQWLLCGNAPREAGTGPFLRNVYLPPSMDGQGEHAYVRDDELPSLQHKTPGLKQVDPDPQQRLNENFVLRDINKVFAAILDEEEVKRKFWRHLLIYAVIVSKHDHQLLLVLQLQLDELTVRARGTLERMPMGEALHAIGLLRTLLVQCGGQQDLRQYWFPRSRQPTCHILRKLLGTSVAHVSCDLKTAREYIIKSPKGVQFPSFIQEKQQSMFNMGAQYASSSDDRKVWPPVSGEDQFWLRCQDWMENAGFTSPPNLRLPDYVGLYIAEEQAIKIEKNINALPEDIQVPIEFHHILGLLWYVAKAPSDLHLQNHLYLASNRFAAYLRRELAKPIQDPTSDGFYVLLSAFCAIESLPLDGTQTHSDADLTYFDDLLQGKTPSSWRSLDSVLRAFELARKQIQDVGMGPKEVNVIVQYWMLRLQSYNHGSAYSVRMSQFDS